MSCAVNVSGTWKYAKQAHVNVNGTWKPCQNIYVNVSGAWKPLYTYSYETGSWGACSADCGGGTQTRTVTCRRRDATNASLDVQTVADSFCAAHGLTKPVASQGCNTQSCRECHYDATLNKQCNGNVYNFAFCKNTHTLSGNSTTVYWNGETIANTNEEVDSITINGYFYERSSMAKDNCSGMNTIPFEIIWTTVAYEVCRVPV